MSGSMGLLDSERITNLGKVFDERQDEDMHSVRRVQCRKESLQQVRMLHAVKEYDSLRQVPTG
jgi:hypothetical protein